MQRWQRNWQRRFLRAWPRRRHLRGSRLHRLVGEGLFQRELWALTRRGLAEGLAVGLFIGCTPTMGFQVILGGLAAYLLKVNIPVTLLATLVSNPLSAPILYPLEYQLGVWMIGLPEGKDLAGFTGAMRSFFGYARPLWAGSLVFGLVSGVLGYGLGTLVWWSRKFFRRRPARVTAGAVRRPEEEHAGIR